MEREIKDSEMKLGRFATRDARREEIRRESDFRILPFRRNQRLKLINVWL